MSTRAAIAVLFAAAACAGEGPSGPTITVGAVLPGEIPEAQAIVHVHWFPRAGSESVAELRVDGVPAVWEDGSTVRTSPDEAIASLKLPTGATTLALVADGHVVASERVDLADHKSYSLVGYGTLAEPQHKLFVDDAAPVEDGQRTFYNFMADGLPVYAVAKARNTGGSNWQPLFEALPYGEHWQGAVISQPMIMMASEVVPLDRGGTVFGADGHGRWYIAYRPNPPFLMTTGDPWFDF